LREFKFSTRKEHDPPLPPIAPEEETHNLKLRDGTGPIVRPQRKKADEKQKETRESSARTEKRIVSSFLTKRKKRKATKMSSSSGYLFAPKKKEKPIDPLDSGVGERGRTPADRKNENARKRFPRPRPTGRKRGAIQETANFVLRS
jgi:hypothetical protein